MAKPPSGGKRRARARLFCVRARRGEGGAFPFLADCAGHCPPRKNQKKIAKKEPAVIVMTIDGLMDRLTGIQQLRDHIITVRVGDVFDMEKMKRQLVELGYERVGMVDSHGQFAVRGGILDIFPLTEETPYRIELWGEEVDSIRSFDASSQRSIENMEQIEFYPANEYVLTKQRLEEGFLRMEQEFDSIKLKLKKEKKQEAYSRLNKMIKEVKEEN